MTDTIADMERLDRTAFHAGTHAEAELYHAQNQPATPAARLRAACLLIARVYGFDPENPPRMDRTVCATRMHENR